MKTKLASIILTDDVHPNDKFGCMLMRLARVFALLGGGALMVIVSINFLSIIGRFMFSSPLVGDFELVEMGCAVAISSFLPYCQLKEGNVIVDFVTSGLSQRTTQLLDAAGAAIFGLVAAFFTWRMIFGARDMLKYNEQTMLLEFPVWIPFLPVVLSFLLLSICCYYTSIRKLKLAVGTH